MKPSKILKILVIIFSLHSAFGYAKELKKFLLPHNFEVYVDDTQNSVINHPAPGFERRILPTINHYARKDGGYVAIYSRQREGSVYSVGDGIYVVGQIRVQGKYIDRIFYPKGYSKGDDITRDKRILSLCHQYFPEFANKVWIGGDTGGWYGIQPDGSSR